MSENCRMFWLHTQSPLHVGTGRGSGFIDLPVAREKTTGWPFVPGSSVKGVLRDHFTTQDQSFVPQAFGTDVGAKDPSAGALAVTDAHLVLFPVRSFHGTFAYTTCPLALQRLARDLDTATVARPQSPPADVQCQRDQPVPAAVTRGCKLVAERSGDPGHLEAVLGEYDVKARRDPVAHEWAALLASQLFQDGDPFREVLRERFIVIPDDLFTAVTEEGTEVQARVRIDDDTHTVATHALWYEETVPPEAVFAGLLWCDRLYAGAGPLAQGEPHRAGTPRQLLESVCGSPLRLQIGGDAGIGRGLVELRFGGEG